MKVSAILFAVGLAILALMVSVLITPGWGHDSTPVLGLTAAITVVVNPDGLVCAQEVNGPTA